MKWKRAAILVGLLWCGAVASLCQAAERKPLPLEAVRSWAYQIQSLSGDRALDELAASSYDMLVVDPTRTDWSSDDRLFDTPAAVARLKGTPASDGVHRKLVLAYIDIGQAEQWRWYWTWEQHVRNLPGFIAAPDPDGWDGNFVVAYWREGWRDILLHGRGTPPAPGRGYVSILDEVLKSGFDGVYLDWVEAFESPEVQALAAEDGVDPGAEMVRLIRDIRGYGQSRQPGFIVIQQNGTALGTTRPEIFEVVDAVAQEEVWFGGIATDDWDEPRGHDLPIAAELTAEYLSALARYQQAGVVVLNVEYALKNAELAYERSYARGFVPYCTRRSLGRLTTTPPYSSSPAR